MTLSHAEAQDLLEAYALWAVDEPARAAVERHLAACDACRAEARELARVADAIPDSVVERSPEPRLRERILAAARAEAPRRRWPGWRPLLRPVWALSLALVVVILVFAGFAIRGQQELTRARAEAAKYEQIAMKVSEGGRWWYMAGVASFRGAGGTLIDPNKDRQAFVLFHDLKALGAGEHYTIWMIAADGSWTRAANFLPSGEELQRVDVPLAVAEYTQCAVSVETTAGGPRAGAVAMQSRVFGN